MDKRGVPWIDLKKLRMEKGWMQKDAAEKLGFTCGCLSSIESGRRSFSLKMTEKIIAVFNVKYEDFYERNERRN